MSNMARSKRSGVYALACPAAALAYLLTGYLSSSVANADTVLMVGGVNVKEIPGAPNGAYMPAIFNGDLCKSGSGNQCVVVPFSGNAGVLTPANPQPLDASVAAGADNLVSAIKNTPGPKIAVGISAGATVVDEAARRLQGDPGAPPPSELSLITAGNINEGIGKLAPPGTHLASIGYTVPAPVNSQYAKTDVTQQFDGLATPPPDPATHMLAAANTVAGGIYAHVGYFTSSIDDPNNTVTQDGNVTKVAIPAQGQLPLIQSLNDIGQPQVAGMIEGALQNELNTLEQAPSGSQAPPAIAPAVVDQMLSTAAPMFIAGVGSEEDRLVNTLAPIFASDPQMMQYIPPALLEDIPQGAAPPAPPAG